MTFQILVVDLFVTSTMYLLPHTAWFMIAAIECMMELPVYPDQQSCPDYICIDKACQILATAVTNGSWET
jgi:hypothetical protein